MTDFCLIALQLSEHHHKNQMYGGASYSLGHIEPVVLQAELIARGLKMDEEEIRLVVATAYLHDILEDTNCTEEHLKAQGLPRIVIDAVKLLTKSCETHGQYLSNVCSSTIAIVVKLADSMCNHRSSLTDGKMKNVLKYAANINYLSTALSREAEKRG